MNRKFIIGDEVIVRLPSYMNDSFGTKNVSFIKLNKFIVSEITSGFVLVNAGQLSFRIDQSHLSLARGRKLDLI
jgi:hypothetical protein